MSKHIFFGCWNYKGCESQYIHGSLRRRSIRSSSSRGSLGRRKSLVGRRKSLVRRRRRNSLVRRRRNSLVRKSLVSGGGSSNRISDLSTVVDSIHNLPYADEIENIVVLGDNYYSTHKVRGRKAFNGPLFKQGMDCIKDLPGKKHILLGNHEIDVLVDVVRDGSKSKLEDICAISKQNEYVDSVRDMKLYERNDLIEIHPKVFVFMINTNVYKSVKIPKKVKDKGKKTKIKGDKNICIDTGTPTEQNTAFKSVQKGRIVDMLTDETYNDMTLLICGHEPLISMKSKKGENVIILHNEILKILNSISWDSKNAPDIYYMCADTHIYQHCNLRLSNGMKITQYTIGTGGTKLDDIPVAGWDTELSELIKEKVGVIEEVDILDSQKHHGYMVLSIGDQTRPLLEFEFIPAYEQRSSPRKDLKNLFSREERKHKTGKKKHKRKTKRTTRKRKHKGK